MLIRYPLENYKKKTLIKVSYKGGTVGRLYNSTQQVSFRGLRRTDGQTPDKKGNP